MAALSTEAGRSGPSAIEAAELLGRAFYNLSPMGNSRTVMRQTYGLSVRPSVSLEWFVKAFNATPKKNREQRARVAFEAAKAELASLVPEGRRSQPVNPLPVPAKWFTALEQLADTQYRREVLAECGHYRRWVEHH